MIITYTPSTVLYAAAPTALGSGNCTDPTDACTLPTALSDVDPGGTIELVTPGSSSVYSGGFTVATAGTSASSPVTVEPYAGVTNPTLDGGNSSAVLIVNGGVYVDISGVTIQNGHTAGVGGGIFNSGTLTVTDSTLSDNTADTAGGGIANNGTVTVSSSTLSGNVATYGNLGQGGGIFNNGTATVNSSTLVNNLADYGDDISNDNAGMTIDSSTVSTNDQEHGGNNGGSAISNGSGPMTIISSTISGNVGNIAAIANGGPLSIGTSIVADNNTNCASAPGSTITSLGYNLTDDASTGNSCNFTAPTDVLDANPQLGPLADNGGPTETFLPVVGSPAVRVIPPGTSINSVPVCGTGAIDQIGNARPLAGGTNCTIGAVEVLEVTCPAGSYSATGYAPCTPAPAGFYDAGTGNTLATSCPSGTYDTSTGSIDVSACTPIPAGSYDASAATAPSPCAAGTYSIGGAAACNAADPGNYVLGSGASSEQACPAGTFSATAGSAACTPAPAGSYAPGGGTAAITCPAGTFSATAGSAACTPAPAGSYSPGGGTAAITCPAGTFSATSGAASCTPAGQGYYAPGGGTAAITCPAGTFSATAGSAACTPAPAGSYAPGGGTAAITCPAGTFSATSGAASCTPAGQGYYVPGSGASSETACPTGTSNTGTGNTACTGTATLTYTGTDQVSINSSFPATATLGPATNPAVCVSNQPVTFSVAPDPLNTAVTSYSIPGTAITSGSGASSLTVSTKGWANGAYVITASYAGTTQCAPATGMGSLAVTAPGQFAFGGGKYTPSAAVGPTGFGFIVGQTKAGYSGQLSVVTPGKWWFQATVTAFGLVSTTQALLSGTGSLYVWNATLNKNHGGWQLAKTGVSYKATATATTKAASAQFGITIAYTPTTGQPALPNSSPVSVTQGGSIVV